MDFCDGNAVASHMLIMQVLARQMPFLANRNAELAIPPLFWPVSRIKIVGHFALLSGTSVYSLNGGSKKLSLTAIDVCQSCRLKIAKRCFPPADLTVSERPGTSYRKKSILCF